MCNRYDLESLISLSNLCDETLCDHDLAYLFTRFTNDLDLYKRYAFIGDTCVASRAKHDSLLDLDRLLRSMDDSFSLGDADTLLNLYIPEYMEGWVY